MKTVKKPTKAHKSKKVIKAHEGMAHVPRQSPANKGMGAPKNMSTNDPSHPQYRPPAPAFARDAMRTGRQIGLPQKFRGGRNKAPSLEQIRAMFGSNPKRISGTMKAVRDSRPRPTAPVPKAPAPVRRAPVMQEPKVITQPKPAVRPPKIMDGDGGRGGRPVFELPNKGRGKNIRRPKPQVRSAQAPRTPMVGKPITRTMQQGGYVSRAKYGIVDNLNKNK